jgi:RHS repeat-associated protein
MRAGVRWARAVVVAVAMAVVASNGQALAAPAKPKWVLPPTQQDVHVPVRPVPVTKLPDISVKTASPQAPAWPAASDTDVTLPDEKPVRASGTSVRIGLAKAGAQPAKAHVHVADQKAAQALGLQGVVMSVASGAPVHIGLDYGPFADAVGGGWADRLTLFELPGCALTTPDKPECRKRTPVESSTNDHKTHQVTADVPASASSARVFAAAASSSGSSGTPTALPLSAAGSWSGGGSSGDFSYSYPFATPSAPSGAAPNLGLSYSSGSVDGLTSATNNQASWAGDGWDFTPGGYVERHYLPCSQDLGGNNGQTKTGDQCWGIDNATLVLGGRSTELIKVNDTLWRPKSDDGSKIELLTGAANGTSHGQYWKVTTGDGTQYFLGLNHLPGWTSGKPETQSTWTVPVFGNNSGEDCYKANDFAHSWCQQAWRWNLDYTVDPHGNASTFYYQPETNSYGLNLNVTTAGTSYTAGGYPLRVEYGLRLENDSLYGSGPTNRVTFDTAERCIPDASFACNPDQLTAANALRWPDVPFDQICASGAVCDYGSPTFFSRKRLTAVHSQYFSGTNPVDVDEWDLTQDFPGSGDASPPALWLTQITHTGKGGGTPITLPPTKFDRYIFPNRVDTLGDKYTPLTRSRLKEIRTETGSRVTIAYSTPDCVAGAKMPASPETDTYRCYAAYWSPPAAKDPVLDWFHKYVVVQVNEDDLTGGSVPVETHYGYPVDGAAWHYDEGQFTPPDQKTWGQWRGYDKVTTSVGNPSAAQTMTQALFLRGMDGDHLPNNGTRHVTVADSDGGSIVDQDPLKGFTREQWIYQPGTQKIDSASINDPWLRGPNATSSDGLLKAYMVNVGTVRGRTLLSDGTTYRRTQVNKKFNDNGIEIQKEDLGDTSTGADDTCTNTTYLANDAGLFDRASEVSMFAGTCAGTATAANSITDVRVSYDHQAFGAAPTKGDITEQDTLDTWDANGQNFVATAKNDYDKYGRETSSTDVFGKTMTTAFTPATGGPVTGTSVTNSRNWTSTTTLDVARGLPTSSEDVNHVRTDVSYDALGRKTAVWNPGRSKAGGDTASAKFEYLTSQTAPEYVVTEALQDTGSYTSSYAIYDGLGRSRQVQVPSARGGRIITDSLYDSRGLPFKTNGAYHADADPSGTLVAAADNNVVNQVVTQFDSRARATATIQLSKGVEQWRSTSIYQGDHITTIPPPGGSPSTVVTDVQGQTVQLLQYTNGYTQSADNPADVTSYTYNAAGAMTSMTDSSGNVWSTGYDLRGRKISQTDPDAGRSTFTYDVSGQLKSTTDARGKSLFYTYDDLGRKTQENADSATGPLLASWTYDTVANGLGLPASATRWDGTNAYASRIGGYDRYSRPTSTAVDIPAKEGALAGTYQFSVKYSATGAIAETVSPKAGNLLGEHVQHTYTPLGLPSTTNVIDENGTTTSLVSQTEYTDLNEMSRLLLDSATSSTNVAVTQTYDQMTRRPQTTTVTRQTQVAPELSKQTYTYDPVGNVRAIANQPANATPDIQCFDYDYLARMTDAWTPSSGNCTTAKSTSALGGAAPYWNTYSFDKSGNRKQQVEHKPTGDVTTTYTYPAAGATSVRPHALQKADGSSPNGTSTIGYTYDDAGSVLTRNAGGDTQTFTYDTEGHTATESDKTGTSSYVYGADGQRLITRDPTGNTLTIGDLEIVNRAGTSTTTATRFYTHGGAAVAERTGSTGVKWMLSDLHGTNGLSITAGTLQPTQRYTDPFGNTRGQAPSAWPDKHGFVGGYQDTTGLTHLGARDYDPVTGRFTQADPVLDPNVPQQWNAYAYGNNAPATMSDPEGTEPHGGPCMQWAGGWMRSDGYSCTPGDDQPWGNCPGCNASPTATAAHQAAANNAKAKAGYNDDEYKRSQQVVKKSKWDVFVDAAGELIKGLIGWDDIKDCVTNGSFGACVRTVINFIPWGKILKAGEIIADFWKGARALITFGKEVEKAEKVIVDSERILADAERAGVEAEKVVADGERAAAETERAAQEAKSAEAAEHSGGELGKCSFVSGTLVVLADGSTKPIDQVQNGDVVLTTNPETGQVERHRVVGTDVHGDEPQRTEATVESHGDSGSIVATDWHPFWVDELHMWVPIGDLVPGEHLHSPDGRVSVVTAVRHFAQATPVYDLTVDEVHDFYVAAGSAQVLVHNCGGASADELHAAATGSAKGQLTPAGRALQKHGDPSPGNIAKRGQAHVDRYDFGKVTNSERSEIADEMIQEILTDPRATDTLRSATAHYGGVTRDIRIPGGWGARWSMRDGKLTFEGFL